MNIKMREIVIVAFIMFVVFPLGYFTYMYLNGKTRLNEKHAVENIIATENAEPTKKEIRAESLAVLNTVTFQAMEKERADIEAERQRMLDDKERLALMQQELEKQNEALKSERERIERLVEKSDTFDKKKNIQLAKAYSAMRPAEAAQILSTLSDELAIRILDGITDDRTRAKIMAALPPEKSTSITEAMAANTRLRKK